MRERPWHGMDARARAAAAASLGAAAGDASGGLRRERVGRPPLGDDRARPREALRHRRRTTSTRGRCATRRRCRSSACARATASASASSTRRSATTRRDGKVPGRARGARRDARRQHRRRTSRPKLVEQMQQPPPPRAGRGQPSPARPEHPVQGRGVRDALARAAARRATTTTKADLIGGAHRSGCRPTSRTASTTASQQFGVEQIMRFIGAPSVQDAARAHQRELDQGRPAPASSSPTSATTTRSSARATRSSRWPSRSTRTDWIDKQRALVNEANEKAQDRRPRPQQVADAAQAVPGAGAREGLHLHEARRRPPGRRLLPRATRSDKGKSEKMRTRRARGAREPHRQEQPERRQRASSTSSTDDANPDTVRGVALARLGELPEGA